MCLVFRVSDLRILKLFLQDSLRRCNRSLLNILNKNENVYSSAHEGLFFKQIGCILIKEFLEDHQDIKNDLFNFEGPMEEFSLQTIILHKGEQFYYIGNGCCVNERIEPNDPNGNEYKFMYKVNREGFTQ
jgi:hypothetical protein